MIWNKLKKMFTHDTLMVKCPNCGTAISNAVSRKAYQSGNVIFKCHVCGRQIRLSPPDSFLKNFFRESFGMVRVYGRALRLMGWQRFLLYGFIWVAGWYFIRRIPTIKKWMTIAIPAIPFAFSLLKSIFIASKNDLIENVGQIRFPFHGMRPNDLAKVSSIEEEYQFIKSRHCPVCQGPFQTGKHNVIYSPRWSHRLRFILFRRVTKLIDLIECNCRQCGRKYNFYFDIDGIDYVKRLHYTQEMILVHMRSVQDYFQKQDNRTGHQGINYHENQN
jgi:endogenous inhibitor of DNA gyrase (YacG/DUF329 family)